MAYLMSRSVGTTARPSHVPLGTGLRSAGPSYSRAMTVLRMDNILLVVDDLEAVKAFFVDLGLELEGEADVGGESVDRLIGLQGVRATIASMRTPDGTGRIELDKFHTPAAVRRSRRTRR